MRRKKEKLCLFVELSADKLTHLTRTGAAHTHSSLTVVSAVGGCGSAGTAGRVLFGSFGLWFLGSTSGYRCMLK